MRNQLPDVPAYPRNDDAGAGALAALHAALRCRGAKAGYEELLLLSGAAFGFVYDNAPVFEPQRDLLPLDVMRTGARATGYNGRWVVDRTPAETLEQVAGALAGGRPAVVSLYSVEGLHGFAVAVGCDPTSGELLVQTGERNFTPDMAPTQVPLRLAAGWSGAVTGPQAWGRCPVFLLEAGAPSGWTAEGRLYRALNRGAALLAGGWTPYRETAESLEFSGVPLAGRQAAYGLPAYDVLAADLSACEWLGGFDVIWRLDAQLTQLYHHRIAAAEYLRSVAHPVAAEAAETCQATARAALELASRFWFKPSHELTTAEDLLSMAGSQRAMVFWLGLDDEERAQLAPRLPVVQTPWGYVAVRDSVPRRKEAVNLVRRMRRQEETLSQLLGQLALAL